jgi:hypothetical protein
MGSVAAAREQDAKLSRHTEGHLLLDKTSKDAVLQANKRMMGLEPTTFCMASRRSSQLSYIRELARL